MSLCQWAISKERTKVRQRALKEVHDRVRIISEHPDTLIKSADDFPEVNQYLSRRFPKIDVSGVIIYLAEPKVVAEAGWAEIGGCYIGSLESIIVKKRIHNERRPKNKFKRAMHDACKMKTDVEDVIIHELIHAISNKLGRSSKKFAHMEEEFVYTNCIDFYKEKGMSENDIVDNNFLPFCLQDVQASRHDMIEVFAATSVSLDDVKNLSSKEYVSFCDEHAEVIVNTLKSKARLRGQHMMSLYNTYGAEAYQTEQIDHTEDTTSLRFSSLDLEDI